MSDAFIIPLIILMVTSVSVWLSLFFLRVTNSADLVTVPFKLRRLAKYLPYLVIALLIVAFSLALMRFTQKVTPLFFFASLGGLVIQFSLIPLALLSQHCREVAIKSKEGKVASWLFSKAGMFTILASKLAWKGFVFFAKAAGRAQADNESGKRSPYGYHGYLTYYEKAKRNNGQRF